MHFKVASSDIKYLNYQFVNINTKGKVSSAIGVFYLLLSEKISSDRLQEVIHYLCDGPQSLEVNKALKVFKTWGKDNGIDFTDEPVLDEA